MFAPNVCMKTMARMQNFASIADRSFTSGNKAYLQHFSYLCSVGQILTILITMAFIKIEKPKQFKYIPRFYDEAKEDLENRIQQIDNEIVREESGGYIPNLKGQFRKRHEALYGPVAKPKGRNISRWFMLIIYASLVIAIIFLGLNILSQLS